MRTILGNERGTALMVAVVGMLIMGVLAISFSLLANVETTIGVNYKQQAQAEALAEAGLDAARDLLRSAGAVTGGFTDWFGTSFNHILKNGETLGPGQYWARIDNDCPHNGTEGVKGFPDSIEESATCDNTTDTNEKAIVTAWAVTGVGRARVRGLVGMDNPWKHVCSNSKNDPGGQYCNSAGNTKGNPSVNPAQPSPPSEHGPKGYDDLPRPVIGCSRVAPSLHTDNVLVDCPLAALNLFAQPAAGGYAAYPTAATLGGPKLVIMGEDPAITTGAKTCNGGGQDYFGYFDCALTTPCNNPLLPGCNPTRKACVKPLDTRAIISPTLYVQAVAGVCPIEGGVRQTGMVFIPADADDDVDFSNTTVGSHATPVTVYVMHPCTAAGACPTTGPTGIPTWGIGPQDTFVYGTVVVEGNVQDKNKGNLCTGGPGPSPAPANSCVGGYPTVPFPYTYGYPLALLVYDPKLPFPTVTPQAPQPILADFGSNNTNINGSVYSGGTLEFNPINVNGASVAFNIDLQASTSSYVYIPLYGNESPPPGFLATSGTPVVLLKSFIVCSAYGNEQASGAVAEVCN